MEISKQLWQKLEQCLDIYIEKERRACNSIDWAQSLAAQFHQELGQKTPVFFPVDMDAHFLVEDFIGFETQKQAVLENIRFFLSGLPYQHILLWGAKGVGKSSLVKALLPEFYQQKLRLVQVDENALGGLRFLFDRLKKEPYFFVICFDDLSFSRDESRARLFKSVLEGAVGKIPDNLLLVATSNRRHLLPELKSDNEGVVIDEHQLHYSDTVNEMISLSDRFGLWISFYSIDQTIYLEIAAHWVKKLADLIVVKKQCVLSVDEKAKLWDEEAQKEALAFTLLRGHRSGRSAAQFAQLWVSRFFFTKK